MLVKMVSVLRRALSWGMLYLALSPLVLPPLAAAPLGPTPAATTKKWAQASHGYPSHPPNAQMPYSAHRRAGRSPLRLATATQNSQTSISGSLDSLANLNTAAPPVAAPLSGFSLVTDVPPTIAVNTTADAVADDDVVSLREAILYADDNPGCHISFNLPASDPGYTAGVATIQPLTPLPSVTANGTIIDGLSQPNGGSSATNGLRIVVNGSRFFGGAGLTLNAPNCVVRGLVINGCSGPAIAMSGPAATGNNIEGCSIGTDPTGTSPVANSTGIAIVNGAAHNSVGGIASTAANRIMFNGFYGVYIGGTGSGNTVRGNTIYSNGNLQRNGAIGINLADPNENSGDITYHDTTQVLSGPNHLQNFPQLKSVFQQINQNGSSTVISGTLKSTPNSSFALDFYRNAALVYSGYGEGQVYLGSATVTTEANGLASFTATFDSFVPQQFVSATATNLSTGDTSEFSRSLQAVASCRVTNTSDSGPGSLRTAITTANAAAPAIITFNIPITDLGFDHKVFTINLRSSLPSIRGNNITLDGASQTAFTGDSNPDGPEIVLNGSTGALDGISLDAKYGKVQDLVIQGFARWGIAIGFNASGFDAFNNRVERCYIGTDAPGTTAVANGSDGIYIYNSQSNIIGNESGGGGNLISGNGANGIHLSGYNAATNMIMGNRIGTNRSGTQALGNKSFGVYIDNDARSNYVGSTDTLGNLISGNTAGGIAIVSAELHSANAVRNNIIGADVNGTAALPNGVGILLSGGTQDTIIGDIIPGLGNLIAYNRGSGVLIFGNATPYPEYQTTGNRIRGNRIFNNGILGINLQPPGGQDVAVLPANDLLDSDTGPNNFENYPLISAATFTGSSVLIQGSLSSAPNAAFTLDFYTNSGANASQFLEGQTFLAARTVTTDATGNVTFSYMLPTTAPGRFITATATDSGNNTSPFSPGLAVVLPNHPPVANDQQVSTDEDTPVVATLTGSDADPQDALHFGIQTLPSHGHLYDMTQPTAHLVVAEELPYLLAGTQVRYVPDTNFNGPDRFTFAASDGQVNSNTATVSITVNPVDDAPTELSLSHDSIAENSPQGTLVGTFTTVDPDAGDTATYSLIDDAGARFKLNGAQLQVADGARLDYEANPQYSITVRSTDTGGLYLDKTFLIHVTDVNEPPTANAGGNQTVTVPHDGNPETNTATVCLKSIGTVDPEGAPLALGWYESATLLGTTPTLLVDFRAGLHPITLQVTDPGGLQSTDTAVITVLPEPNTPPVANPGVDRTIECSGVLTAVALDGTQSYDADQDLLNHTWKEGDTLLGTGAQLTVNLAAGVHRITLIVTDSYGAAATDEVILTVRDTTPPLLQCPSNIKQGNDPGQCSAKVTLPTVTAIDLVDGAVVASGVRDDHNVLTAPFSAGTTIITWTATDQAGNSATCQQSVTIEDREKPIFTRVPGNVTYQCPGDVPAAQSTDAQATDNCTVPIIAVKETNNGGAGTAANPLIIMRIYTATDDVGNQATATQTITVADTTAPVPDVVVLPDVTGQCSATITTVPTATDNCSGSVRGTTTDPLTYDAPGTYTVSWTYTDGHGNTAIQRQKVIVHDTVAPQISGVTASPAVLSPANHQMVSVTIGYALSDNCTAPVDMRSSLSVQANETLAPGDVVGIDAHHLQLRAERAPAGNGRIYTIVITAQDTSGNISTTSVTVTVPKGRSTVSLSTATVRVNTQAITLDFTGPLNAQVSADAGHYAVQVNGQGVPVLSAAYDTRTNKVTLELQNGTLSRGDTVLISWNGLLDSSGNVLSGQASPLTAH